MNPGFGLFPKTRATGLLVTQLSTSLCPLSWPPSTSLSAPVRNGPLAVRTMRS
ncbi:hypothetical protein PF008_g19126 [Phytophthora fragariae]|uniref:Uncharacterized protein n=1 Tax=Phytophthora fragariae TaxID=53985 RepID=A0A6G0R3G5_9STRA|nr:hypothetical protein PF008_g19126 [Phytophthora fragariae]